MGSRSQYAIADPPTPTDPVKDVTLQSVLEPPEATSAERLGLEPFDP